MIKAIRYINGTFDEEMALVIDNKVVLNGDYYHDKISETISGFIQGLEYCGHEVEVEEMTIHPDDPMFDTIGFYNEEEYSDEDEDDENYEDEEE